jgi:hypothetical protein
MLPAVLVFASATAAWAQEDALLPTHLIEGGQVFATATARYLSSQGDSTLFAADAEVKSKAFQVQLDAGVGLGMGFEIDASITAQFVGQTKADVAAAATTIRTESEGFSDLAVAALYRILKDDPVTPQLIVGAVVVAPVGNDKSGRPEFSVSSVKTDSEEGGLGEGVWRYGLEAGISKNLAVVEPYLLTSYIFGGTRRENGVKEDRADVWSLLVGAQWRLSSQVTLDTRAVFSRVGEDETESSGSKAKEEVHVNTTGQASLYVHLGSGVTLTLGGGVVFVEDHEVNDLLQLSVEDNFAWFAQAGLHILIGAGPK